MSFGRLCYGPTWEVFQMESFAVLLESFVPTICILYLIIIYMFIVVNEGQCE